MTDKNIVFIGLPGCGKTTVSHMLAQRLGRSWYDCDGMIEDSEGMRISQIFAEKGEEYFRARETEMIGALLEKEDAVISVGGGAVLHNGDILRSNALVIYLYRDIWRIEDTLKEQADDTRPLLSGGDNRLRILYEQRRGLYETICHMRVNNNQDAVFAVDKIAYMLPYSVS